MTTDLLAPALPRRIARRLTISAWAVPVMVLGQFALLSGIPIGLLLSGALRKTNSRPLQWAAAFLTASYVTPLTIWLLRPNRARSLSKDIDPSFVALIVVASATVLVTLYTLRRRTNT